MFRHPHHREVHPNNTLTRSLRFARYQAAKIMMFAIRLVTVGEARFQSPWLGTAKRRIFLSAAVTIAMFAAPSLAASQVEPCREDIDGNFVIDADDFFILGQCLTGPDVVIKDIECRIADLHRDNRIDLRDAAIMQNQAGPCHLCTPQWAENLFDTSVINGGVLALTVFDDGASPALYVGGNFTKAGDSEANFVAKWDGTSWSPLGTGMNGPVYTLAVFDDGTGEALYAGGSFTTAGGISVNHIAKWDGLSWSTLGTGVDRTVYALSRFDSGGDPILYAGGVFTTPSGKASYGIARWDGMSWLPLGAGISGAVYSLAVFDDGSGEALYVGGEFGTLGEVSAQFIAKWNDTAWEALESGPYYFVSALSVFDDGGGPALIVGGGFQFQTASGEIAKRIAKWDGSIWSSLGIDIPGGSVRALTTFDDGLSLALYAGGSFLVSGRSPFIVKWDGSFWSSLGTGVNNSVAALTVFDDGTGPALFAGGGFTTAGGNVSPYLAKWYRPTDCEPPPATPGR